MEETIDERLDRIEADIAGIYNILEEEGLLR